MLSSRKDGVLEGRGLKNPNPSNPPCPSHPGRQSCWNILLS